MRWLLALLALLGFSASARATEWREADLTAVVDDDLARHASDYAFLDGLSASETRFSEAGFDWQLLRFTNTQKPDGPLWVVPHDDENAAFEAAITALKLYGGMLIAVNSGPGSSRYQPGRGTCGGRLAILARCDPNRNFSAATPLYTQAFVGELKPGQPIIALHTNSPGFGKGQGSITILDAAAAAQGVIRPRKDGYFGINQPKQLLNFDSYAIMPYLAPSAGDADITCRNALRDRGVNVWHERVSESDGSLSNYMALNHPEARYVNMESRREVDLSVAAERHRLMIAAYIEGCLNSGNQPASVPAILPYPPGPPVTGIGKVQPFHALELDQ